jgi:hypothetical protein
MRMPRVVVELAVRGPRGAVSARSAVSVRGRFRSLMNQEQARGAPPRLGSGQAHNTIDIMAWRGI